MPSSLGLSFQPFETETVDGYRIHGWYVPAEGTETLTLLYCHGNAGNISNRLKMLHLLHQLGLNVAIFDYRGYGNSEGKPTEEGTYYDALATWNYLQTQYNIAEENMIIMGRSLGGPIAAWLACRCNPAAVILESTFTSAAELGSDKYSWLPVEWLLKFEYDTREYLKQLKAPVFMAHSTDDEVVPFSHGKRLFKVASEPKMFVELKGSHAEGFLETKIKYCDCLKEFLEMYTTHNEVSCGKR
jgi:hypothetical protein